MCGSSVFKRVFSHSLGLCSAGQTGPLSRFFNDMDAPEHQSAETLGRALFDNESFEAWSQVYTINSSSIFFVTTAFAGLLAKGSEDQAGYQSCVVNISSISGHMKLAQNHVCTLANNHRCCRSRANPRTVCLQQLQGCCRAPHEDACH